MFNMCCRMFCIWILKLISRLWALQCSSRNIHPLPPFPDHLSNIRDFFFSSWLPHPSFQFHIYLAWVHTFLSETPPPLPWNFQFLLWGQGGGEGRENVFWDYSNIFNLPFWEKSIKNNLKKGYNKQHSNKNTIINLLFWDGYTSCLPILLEQATQE